MILHFRETYKDVLIQRRLQARTALGKYPRNRATSWSLDLYCCPRKVWSFWIWRNSKMAEVHTRRKAVPNSMITLSGKRRKSPAWSKAVENLELKRKGKLKPWKRKWLKIFDYNKKNKWFADKYYHNLKIPFWIPHFPSAFSQWGPPKVLGNICACSGLSTLSVMSDEVHEPESLCNGQGLI